MATGGDSGNLFLLGVAFSSALPLVIAEVESWGDADAVCVLDEAWCAGF